MDGILNSPNVHYIQKIRIKKSMYQNFYLLHTVFNETGFDLKVTGSTLNVYTVRLSETLFKCDCKDFDYCNIHDIYCKHICFVICYIGKLRDEKIFTDRVINSNQIRHLSQRLQMECYNDPNIVNNMLINRFQTLTKSLNEPADRFKPVDNPPNFHDNDCVICCLSLTFENILRCPDCLKIIHKSCMKEWLTRSETCPFCRSKIWNECFKDSSGYLNISLSNPQLQTVIL